MEKPGQVAPGQSVPRRAWGAVLTATLYRNGQGTWAELPERVQVAYDEDNERLVLASEGVYVRDCKEYEY